MRSLLGGHCLEDPLASNHKSQTSNRQIACRAHEQYDRGQLQRSQIHLSRAAKSGLKGVRELLAAISIVRAGNTATNALKEGGLRNAL